MDPNNPMGGGDVTNKVSVKVDDRQVDGGFGGTASGGGMYPGYGGYGLGAGLGLGVLGGAAIAGGGWGYGGGYGYGGYGQGLGSPLGVGFVGFGLAELASNQRQLALQAQMQGAERSAAAQAQAIQRDVLQGQTQVATTAAQTQRDIFEGRLEGLRSTQAILQAICAEGRGTAAQFAALGAANVAQFNAIGIGQERGFAGSALQAQSLSASLAAQQAALAASTSREVAAGFNCSSAQNAALGCAVQALGVQGATDTRFLGDQIAASTLATQQGLRGVQSTICSVGTQGNANDRAIGAGIGGTVPVAVPFPGAACTGCGC